MFFQRRNNSGDKGDIWELRNYNRRIFMKKIKKNKFLIALLCGILLISTAGCGGQKSVNNESMGATDTAAFETEAAEPREMQNSKFESFVEADMVESEEGSGITSESGIEPVAENNRKLIKNVNLEMQTKEFDVLLESLSKKVQSMGGYIENSSIYGNRYYSTNTRSADYTVRIPSKQLDEFVSVVGEMGNITYKNEDVQDVTLQYTDVESHKKALETEQDRLLELLEHAENMEDLLAIESKLSEVRYELENYTSQMRVLDNQIDYSTVYIHISEVEHITETKDRTFFEEVGDRFQDSLFAVGNGLRGFTVGFLGSLPILAVWVVIIAAIVLAVKKLLKASEKRREKKLHKSSEEEPPKPAE